MYDDRGDGGAVRPVQPFGTDANDGVVSVCETRAGVLLPVLHTFMMDAAAVRERILAIMTPDRTSSIRSPIG